MEKKLSEEGLLAALTPPQLARRWGVAANKVNNLIASGQLKAINLTEDPNGRPRYRILNSEIIRFERNRLRIKQ